MFVFRGLGLKVYIIAVSNFGKFKCIWIVIHLRITNINTLYMWLKLTYGYFSVLSFWIYIILAVEGLSLGVCLGFH